MCLAGVDKSLIQAQQLQRMERECPLQKNLPRPGAIGQLGTFSWGAPR